MLLPRIEATRAKAPWASVRDVIIEAVAHEEPTATDPKARTWRDQLSTSVKLIFAAITALIVTAGALFAIVGNPFAPDPREAEAKKSPPAVAAYQIARCRKTHGLGAATVVITNRPAAGAATRRSFERCEWPPPVSTSADGYTLIENLITVYAGKGAAAPFNALHKLTAPCDRLS